MTTALKGRDDDRGKRREEQNCAKRGSSRARGQESWSNDMGHHRRVPSLGRKGGGGNILDGICQQQR